MFQKSTEETRKDEPNPSPCKELTGMLMVQ